MLIGITGRPQGHSDWVIINLTVNVGW